MRALSRSFTSSAVVPRATIALALLAFALGSTRIARAQDANTPAIEVRVEVGFDGAFVEGAWVPISVTLETPPNAPPLTGRVVLDPLPLERVAWFAAPFALPSSPAGARTRVFLGAPSWGDRTFAVRVEDQDGREIKVTVPSSRRLDAKDRLVLATRSAGLAAFGDGPSRLGVPATGPSIQLVRAAPGLSGELRDRIPTRSELLQSLATVVVADAPGVTDLLRDPERASALEQWVQSGGSLIVVGAGSPFWTGTPLEERLPVTALGARAVVGSRELSFLGPVPAGTAVAVASLREGCLLLEGTPTRALVAARPFGSGRFVFLAFDPDALELRGSSEVARFLRTLVGSAHVDSPPIALDRLARLSQQAWEDLTPLSIPGLAGVGLVAFLAAAIVGIGAARRRGRPDRVWIAPLFSAALAAVVVLWARVVREPSHTRSISWVFVEPGGGSGTAVEDLALVAGRAATFELSLAPGVLPLSHDRPRIELVDFRARRSGLTFVDGAAVTLGPVDLVPKGLASVLLKRSGSLPQAPAVKLHLDGPELVLEPTGHEPVPAGLALVVDRGSARLLLVATPVVSPGAPVRVAISSGRDLIAGLRRDEAAGPLWDRSPDAISSALLVRTLALLEPHPTQMLVQGPFAWLVLPGPVPALATVRERPRSPGDLDPLAPIPSAADFAVYVYSAESP